MSKIIIERERVRGTYGDGISEFDIKLSKDTTVAGFLASIVKDYPQEYGTVYINNKEVCAYSNGELVFYETELDINDYADFFVFSATGRGGWGLMSYYLKIDDRAKVCKLTKLLDKIQAHGIDIDCEDVVDNEDIAWFLLKRGVVL